MNFKKHHTKSYFLALHLVEHKKCSLKKIYKLFVTYRVLACVIYRYHICRSDTLMTCVQYLIKDADERNITQKDFEHFLQINFPGYIPYGVIKFLDSTIARNYDILDVIEDNGVPLQKYLGKIHLQFKPDETVISVNGSKDTQGLVDKLMSKNTVHIDWYEKPEHFRHEYD